jgi:hypothetical protein
MSFSQYPLKSLESQPTGVETHLQVLQAARKRLTYLPVFVLCSFIFYLKKIKFINIEVFGEI